MTEWKKYRVKDVARLIGSGATPTSGNDRYYENGIHYWVNTGDFNNSEIYGCKQLISDTAIKEIPTLRFYPINTILVAMYGASIGKVGILKVKATVNQACCAIALKENLFSSRFLFYLLINCKDSLLKESFGGTQPNVSKEIIANLIFEIPSLQEQQRIVEYLDAKTTEIDKRIELLGKKRDAYKRLKIATINRAVTRGLDEHDQLKDSGIEWLGEIPAHWETRRIKDFFTNVSGNGFKVEFQGNEQGDYPFYKVSDLNGETKEVSHAKNYVTKSIAAQESYNIIPAHSILFPKIGEALKKNYRRINIDQCCVDNNCSALVIKDLHICLNYAYYIMRCIDMSWFDNGGTIPSVCISKLMSTSIPVPSFREQEFIVHYIDNRCAKIDAAVTIIDKQIDALKRLKRSLINEVVTGKRKV